MTPPEATPDFDAVLERLGAESAARFAAGPVRLDRRRVVVRPYSHVLELDVQADGRTTGAFVKILKPRFAGPQELEATRRNIAREFEVTTKLYAHFAAHPGASTARPIACYPEFLALVTERVDGTPLRRLVTRARGFPSASAVQHLSAIMQRVGAWLRVFQTLDPGDGRVSLDQMRTYLDARLQPLADGGMIARGLRAALLRYFDARASEVPADDLHAVAVHADFTPENVIVRENDVSVLDFATVKRGGRYLDLSHMVMQLDLLKARPWFRPAVVDRLTTSLLAGFDPRVRADQPFFDLFLLQHVACHLRQLQQSPPPFPTRLYTDVLRRRHLKWLAARARVTTPLR